MAAIVGGEKAWKTRTTGDICSSFEWVNGDPAMILYPARRRTNASGAYVIPIGNAHKFARRNGHPRVTECAETAMLAANQMGMSTDPFTLKRIIDVILDGLADLIEMPPEPDWTKHDKPAPIVGEMTIKRDGETILERDVPALSAAEQ